MYTNILNIIGVLFLAQYALIKVRSMLAWLKYIKEPYESTRSYADNNLDEITK